MAEILSLLPRGKMNNLFYDISTVKGFVEMATESLEHQKVYLKIFYDKNIQDLISYESNVVLIEAAMGYLETVNKLLEKIQYEHLPSKISSKS